MFSQKKLYERWQRFISQLESEEQYQSFEDFVADYYDEIYHSKY